MLLANREEGAAHQAQPPPYYGQILFDFMFSSGELAHMLGALPRKILYQPVHNLAFRPVIY